MEKSNRFRLFIDAFENVDPDEIANTDIEEIEKRTGLVKGRIRELIIDQSIGMINERNFAKIFDMLHEFMFDNFEILLKKLNDTKVVYDISNLDGNYGLKQIFSETCICEKKKCHDIETSIVRGHIRCLEKGKKFYLKSFDVLKAKTENTYKSFEWMLLNDRIDVEQDIDALIGLGDPKIMEIVFKYHDIKLDIDNQITLLNTMNFDLIKICIPNILDIKDSFALLMNDDKAKMVSSEEIIKLSHY